MTRKIMTEMSICSFFYNVPNVKFRAFYKHETKKSLETIVIDPVPLLLIVSTDRIGSYTTVTDDGKTR